MTHIRDDFPLPEIVMPEFLRPGSDLYNLVPSEVHEARKLIASSMSIKIQDLEHWLVEEYIREPSAKRPDEAFKLYDFRTRLELYFEKGHPLAGSDFPFFKPSVKELRSLYEAAFAGIEAQFSMFEEVNGGNVQVTIEPLRQDAPYLFFFRYMKNPPKVYSRLYFGAVYHSWKDYVSFGHLASDYRTYNVYTRPDVSNLLQRGVSYIKGISRFLDALE